MSVSDGKITAPVSISDVSSALRHNSNSLVTLCTSGRINKKSKCKPIRHNSVGPLTEEERVGSSGDIAEGYYYGVRLCLPNGLIKNLHSMEFDYRAVRRGEDWSRLGDFDGYDRNAVLTPQGSIPAEAYIDKSGAAEVVIISYDTENTTGINLSEAMTMTRNDGKSLGDMYPCLLLTIGTKHYVRALWNMYYSPDFIDSKVGYTKMKHDEAWRLGWGILLDGLTDATAGTVATATVFFVDSITDASANRDWREWTLVGNDLAIPYLYPCPEAVGKSLTLRKLMTQGVGVKSASWTLHASGAMINVTLTLEWLEPQTGDTYTITGTVKKANGTTIGAFSAEVAYPAGSNFVFKTVSVTEQMMTGSENLTLEWTVRSAKFAGAICNSGTTSMN